MREGDGCPGPPPQAPLPKGGQAVHVLSRARMADPPDHTLAPRRHGRATTVVGARPHTGEYRAGRRRPENRSAPTQGRVPSRPQRPGPRGPETAGPYHSGTSARVGGLPPQGPRAPTLLARGAAPTQATSWRNLVHPRSPDAPPTHRGALLGASASSCSPSSSSFASSLHPLLLIVRYVVVYTSGNQRLPSDSYSF